jgi:hypothetical protein
MPLRSPLRPPPPPKVGSKAELAMVMSILAAHPGANLICNGIKDAEYMELVGGGVGWGVDLWWRPWRAEGKREWRQGKGLHGEAWRPRHVNVPRPRPSPPCRCCTAASWASTRWW